jgi:hypothetical protein
VGNECKVDRREHFLNGIGRRDDRTIDFEALSDQDFPFLKRLDVADASIDA